VVVAQGDAVLTASTKESRAVPARPVTRQQPELAKVSLLAQKCGVPVATDARSGRARASKRAPLILNRPRADPDQASFTLIDPSA
jgi:hypothetical protein